MLLLLLATLTLSDWEQRVNNTTSPRLYTIDETYRLKAQEIEGPENHRKSQTRVGWCDMERNARDTVNDLKKAQILETIGITLDGKYQTVPLTPQDLKYLQVIQIDWETKEKEAHNKCTS